MTGEALDGFVCPVCRARLAREGAEGLRCAGASPHAFPVRAGAPVLLPDGAGQALALESIADAASKWAAARGDRWEAARRKVWKAVVRASLEVAPPPGMFADLGAGGAGLASLAAHARYQAVALDAGMPPEGPYLRAAASFEALPLADGSLRVAAFVASLHYASDLRGALREAARVLGEGGALLIALTPVHSTEGGAADAAASTREEIQAHVGDNTLSDTYKHLTRAELWGALDAAGFQVEERRPGFGAGYAALRAARARVSGSEFASFPLLLCRPGTRGGPAP